MKALNLEIRYQHRSIIFLEKLLIFINLLIPLALVTGPFLSDLIIVISSILFIFFSIYEKKYFFYKNIHFFIFVTICIFFLFTSFKSNDVLFSLESSLFYFRFGFFALSVWYIQMNYESFSLWLFFSFLFTILIVCIDAIIQFYIGTNFLGFPYDGYRLSGFFGDELKLGSYISRLSPIFIALYVFNKKKINNYFFFLLILTLILSLITVFLSGERVSSFYFLLVYLSILFLSFKNIKLLFITLFSSIIIFMTFSFSEKAFNTFTYRNIISTIEQSNLLDTKKNEVNNDVTLTRSAFKEDSIKNNLITTSNKISQFLKVFNNLSYESLYEKVKNNEIYIFTDAYHGIYMLSVKIINRNFLFGIGPKLFRKECKKRIYYNYKDYDYMLEKICTTHPHNTHLQLFVETGFIGFLLSMLTFLIILTRLMYNFFNFYLLKKNIFVYKYFMYLALFITFFPLQPTGSFFNNWNSIIYYIPVGFLLKEIYNSKVR